MSDADFCRHHNLKRNNYVSGVCPLRGVIEVRITAIGERAVLARRKGAAEYHNWNFGEWTEVEIDGNKIDADARVGRGFGGQG